MMKATTIGLMGHASIVLVITTISSGAWEGGIPASGE